jgi:hypothetical protein
VVGVAIVSLILLFSCLDDDDEVYLNISNCGSEVTAAVIFSS